MATVPKGAGSPCSVYRRYYSEYKIVFIIDNCSGKLKILTTTTVILDSPLLF